MSGVPPHPASDVTGLLLTGGQSRRFGTDKARFPLGGRTMAGRVYDVLAPLVAEVMLSVRIPGTGPELLAEEVADLYPGAGPLAGLHAGLARCRTPWLLAVACDMPFLTMEALVAVLAARTDSDCPVLARAQAGKLQPLCALYPAFLLPTVESSLASGQYAVHALLETVGRWKEVILPEDLLRNVNTQADLDGTRI